MSNPEKEEKKDGILLPAGTVGLLAIVVLLVIIGQVSDVWDYFQEEEIRYGRVIMESLSTLGWGILDWYLWAEVWDHHKRKKKATA